MSAPHDPEENGINRADAEALCRYARQMVTDGLAEGTSGNLSVRRGDLVAVTPSAVPPERMTPEDICRVRLDGTQLAGPGRPSSELPMHLAIYHRTDALAIVHTHSPWTTAVSTVATELPPIHYLLTFLGEAVRVAPYATPGSTELGDRVVEALSRSSAVILQNHGAVTVGPSLERAYWYASILEWVAALWSRASLLGTPRLLSTEEMAQAAEALRDYGGLGDHGDLGDDEGLGSTSG
ncbi:MAG: class II aldolase/adducin family protein [Pseudonocardiaceae bacterium]